MRKYKLTIKINQSIMKHINKALLLASAAICFNVSSYALDIPLNIVNTSELQDDTVTGRVVDAKGEPIIGATIIEKGNKTNGTITDFDGNFSISISGNAVLEVSYIGYKTQTIKSKAGNKITITLIEDNEMLDEVVVVGFGTQKRKDVVGAIASVTAKDLKASGQNNVLEGLQGSVAGLRIDIPSSPTAEPSVRIRGLNSLSSDNSPLYVVDGIPFEDMQSLNPNDIQSIEVLKDASAAAIYGSRAANGVLIITTKKSSKGKPIVNASFTYSFKNLMKDPELMGVEDYISYKQECALTKGLPTNIEDVLTASEYNVYLANKAVDPFEMMINDNAPSYESSLSVSGDKVRYYFSVNYTNIDGLVRGTGFDRISLRNNLDIDLNKYIKLSNYTSVYLKDSQDLTGGDYGLGAMYRLSPLSEFYNEDGSYTTSPMKDDPLFGNPMSDAYDIDKKNRTKSINNITSLNILVPHIEGLSLGGKFSFDIRNWTLGKYAPQTTKEGENGSVCYRNYTNTDKWYVEGLIAYKRSFGNHNLDLTGMASAESYVQEGQSQSVTGIESDDYLWYQPESSVNAPKLSTSYTKMTNVGLMMRANYNYANKYYLTMTMRRDAFSGFSDEQKWATFPSVAVAWRVNEENFMQGLDYIDNLKLRVSYGALGNQAISPYQTFARLSNLASHIFGQEKVLGYNVSSLPTNLKWETTYSSNVGLDFSLFKNRLFGSIEVYKNITKDLLVNRNIPSMMGQSTMWTNSCKVQNTGIELDITGKPVSSHDFEVLLGGNISYNKNKIVEIYGGKEDDLGNQWFIGEPIGVVYTQKFLGIWQLGEETEAAKYDSKPGYPKLEDCNKDGKIDDNDRQVLGTTVPPILLGLRGSIRWKDLTLSLVANGAFGHLKSTSFQYLDDGRFRNFNIKNYWTPENPSNEYMRPGINPVYIGSIYTHRADWLKIKNITLAYNIPSKLINTLGLASCNVSLSLQDYFSFYSYPFIDPETGNGIGSYPASKQVKFGINVSF